MECWLVLLAMKLCQHTTVSGLRCVIAFGLAHHLGCTGESRNDVEIPVLDLWPLWLGRLRRILSQWLYIMCTCEKRKRIWFLATAWSFLLLGDRHVYASSAPSTSHRKRQNEHLFLYTTLLLVQPSNQLPCNAVVGSTTLCLIQHHQPPFWFGMFGCLLSWRHIRDVKTSFESSRV